MYHRLPRGARFCRFLSSVDQDLAEETRKQACPCGGRLHRADYPRKPRGDDALPQQYSYRFSFCCERDGCRKRMTPPSVRFLGRKVYLAAVVVFVAAMRHGASPGRFRKLSKLFGADRRTIARWRVLWNEHFPQTPFWKVERARFVPVIDDATLPLSLLNAFLGRDGPYPDWVRLLQFLSPITTAEGLKIRVAP
jgi:hypothetical protein